MPAVSVIIPVYKVERYIAQCARSLFGQTLQDIEYLFIDDCTPDRSMEILRQVLEDFPERESQVTCHRMQHNSGQAQVRMYGITHVTGEYVIHCDSDDFVHPDAYRILYEAASSGQYDIVSCNFLKGDGERWEPSREKVRPGQEASDILTGRFSYSLCTKLIRRRLLQGIMAPTKDMGEDSVISVQAVCRAKRFLHLPKELYYYRSNPLSISRTAGEEDIMKRWRACKENVDLLAGLLQTEYGYREKSPEIVFIKYNCRHWLEPYIQDTFYFRLWKNTYPEIDSTFLFMPRISLENKFWFVMIHLRLFHSIKRLTQKLRG